MQCSNGEGGETKRQDPRLPWPHQLALKPLHPPPAGTAAAAATTAAAAPAPPGTVAAPAQSADTVAEPQNQPVLVSVAPIQKKKCEKKSVSPVRDDNEPGPSQEQEKEAEPEIIAQSLSLSELRDRWKHFSCHPGEHVVTWLPRSWIKGPAAWNQRARKPSSWDPWSWKGALTR